MDGIILVSIIGYKEKDLAGTVRDAYFKAKNPKNIRFSIVDETYEDSYADLSFIPEDQILYKKIDLSEYRGILWARNLTNDHSFEYDYILYICAHTRFAKSWDEISIEEYKKAQSKSETGKAVLTYCGADFVVNEAGEDVFDGKDGIRKSIYTPRYNQDFVPGYWFPAAMEIPDDDDVHEGHWVHFTWCFASKKFVQEIPLDPEINFNAEEPYVTIQAWCRGWRMFATAKDIYWHHRVREYPGDQKPRHMTHRPWVDKNKKDYWLQSDMSMLKLNLLLSGNLNGVYGDISLEKTLEFCEKSGLDKKYTEYDPDYDKKDIYQHGKFLKEEDPINPPV